MAPVIVGKWKHPSHLSSRSFRLSNFYPSPLSPKCPSCTKHSSIASFIYIHRFTSDNQLSMEFGPFGVSLKILRTHALLLTCNSEGYHYLLFTSAVVSSSNASGALSTKSSDLWHCRLGHPDALMTFNKISCCNNLPGLCHACQLGKHTRFPYNLSTSNHDSCLRTNVDSRPTLSTPIWVWPPLSA
jgi:hypothetical protein